MGTIFNRPGSGGDWVENDEYETTELGVGTFEDAVRQYIRRETDHAYGAVPTVLMTCHSRWSGYSEYTITSSWDEFTFTVPDWDWEKHFDSLPAVFAALSSLPRDQ